MGGVAGSESIDDEGGVISIRDEKMIQDGCRFFACRRTKTTVHYASDRVTQISEQKQGEKKSCKAQTGFLASHCLLLATILRTCYVKQHGALMTFGWLAINNSLDSLTWTATWAANG